MKTQHRHLVILSLFFATLLGWCNMAQADNIYWKPSSGNDSNNGSNEAKAVKSFERAKELVTSPDDWIILLETLKYNESGTYTLDGNKGSYNVRVKRNDGSTTPTYMIDIGAGVTLTLRDITISGGFTDDVHDTTRESPYGNSAIYFSADGSSYSLSTLNIETGTVIEDSWSNYGGAIKMYRGNTINMTGGEIYNCGGTATGGAIYLSAYRDTDAVFNMSGGTIRHCRSVQGGGAVSFSNFENASTQVDPGHPNACFPKFGHITFNMSGTATIEDCIYKPLSVDPADTRYYGGGAVAIYQVAKENVGSIIYVHQWELNKFEMTGGTISNCHADSIHGFGGAIFVNNKDDDEATPVIISGNAMIKDCYSEKESGGGIYMQGLTSFSMNGGTIMNCSAPLEYGGGIYITGDRSSSFELKGGAVIDNCDSPKQGGGVFLDKKIISCVINDAEIKNCDCTNNSGGGLYISSVIPTGGTHPDTIVLELKKAKFHLNKATTGGAIDINIGKVIMDAGVEIYGNEAKTGIGGAMNLRSCHFIMNGGKIYDNHSATDGGAIHLTRSAFILNDGEFYSNYCNGSGGVIHFSYCTDAYESAGYHAPINGRVTLSGGKFYNNKAARGGCLNFNTCTIIDIPSTSTIEMYDNEASCGGVFSVDGAELHIAGGTFHGNTALETCTYLDGITSNIGKGGVIVCRTWNTANKAASLVRITGGEFYDNESSSNGGCVFVKDVEEAGITDPNVLEIQGGEIYDNHAGDVGGAIYFEANTKLRMQGSVKIKGNRTNNVPNNIYLLSDVDQIIEVTGAFTPQYVGIFPNTDATLTKSDIPIFKGTQANISDLNSYIASSTYKVIDDKQLHRVKYPGSTILSFGIDSPWSPLQQTVNTLPTKVNNVYQIGTVEELTAFLWLVNNIDTHHDFNADLEEAETTHPEASARLTADINMEGHYWVPIDNYTGTFDGNGYVISHLTMVPTNVSTERGLFGVNTSGTIKNVNLHNGYFGGGGSYIGTIVYQMDGGSLYNSVAQCQMLATDNTTTAGGLVGRINGGTVHSSIATCEMTGYTMGGLVGTLTSGNLYNSFANPKFTHSGSGTEYVGGLVAIDTALIENCYVRLERNQSLGSARFGMLVGSTTAVLAANNGQVIKCYAPDKSSSQFNLPATYYYLYNDDQTGLSNCDLYKKVDAPYLYNRPNDNLVGSTPLYKKLNDWVSSQISSNSELAYWKRTTAGGYSYTYNDGVANITVTGGNINDDYPMPKMKGLSNVSSVDGFYFDYAPSLSRAITKYNGLTGGGTVWLYASPKNAAGADEEVNVDNDSDVLLYIDEDATLLQADNNSLTAYTSQTLKVETESRWHFISSSLSNSDIGFNYGTTSQVDFDWSENPCNVTFNGNNDDALFPIDMPNINKVDLYAFYEPEYHWLNLKRNTNSHWHMNATTTPIAYNGNGTGGNGNETYLVPGKGYLASIDKDQLLQNKGTLNNGAGTVTVQDITYNEANAWAGLLGYNLLGNPYQSYLDFNTFIEDAANSGLNASKGNAEPTYAVYDPEIGSYIQYKSGSSKGSRSADGMIHPHQGFMIRRTGGSYSATATFKNTMRSTNSTSPFRGEQPAFPLVNLTVTDDEGNADVAVLELGRDADRGAEKLRANTCKGWLYLHHDNDDYGILFRSEVEDYQPLWFEASEAGTYTMRWETANGEFESLTLVDNIAGVVTDMLATDSYVFEANPDQYKSRFKIVIGDYKGIEENEGGASTSSATDEIFAFISNGNIIVNGIGTLQVIDILGRELVSEELSTPNSQLSTLNYTPGVYVLRLTTGKGTKIQKMVIE